MSTPDHDLPAPSAAHGRHTPQTTQLTHDVRGAPELPALRGPLAPVLARLLAERGLAAGDWWPFLVQGEGKRLPGPEGLEEHSGFVLDRSGAVHGWWLGWEHPGGDGTPAPGGGEADRTSDAGRYVLERWWQVREPERAFARDAEYRAARRRLGLPALPASARA